MNSISSREHKSKAPKKLGFAIIICSTSRFEKAKRGSEVIDDVSGKLILNMLKAAGHRIVYKQIVPDNTQRIKAAVCEAVCSEAVDVVITCGGTGISNSDVTFETVTPLLKKPLPGFGEIFRKLSFEKVGSSAFLTRAFGGICEGGKAVFCIPGSPEAAKLSLEKLILPEAGHIVKHARE